MRHGSLECAAAEAEREQLLDLGPALLHEVEAGDATVDDAVLHVLRDIRCAHEQNVDRRVPAREGEGAVAGSLGPEARILEEGDRRLAQSPGGRDRNPQPALASFFLRRSSASR